MKDHFDEVWNIIQREKAAKDGEAVDDKKKKGEGEDFGKSDFAKHFARHCKRAQTYEEVLTWCAANIKVKKQKLKDEGGASDNKQTERTVYQLTCKDCKVSNTLSFAWESCTNLAMLTWFYLRLSTIVEFALHRKHPSGAERKSKRALQ